MSSDRWTVAACVFQGHMAEAHGRHECPLAQALARRLLDADIATAPECVEREVCKYRAVARVIACPLLATFTS
jgi:hypothetical protein